MFIFRSSAGAEVESGCAALKKKVVELRKKSLPPQNLLPFQGRLCHPTRNTGAPDTKVKKCERAFEPEAFTSTCFRFGPEESEPVMEKAGREKRRKKQAVRHFIFIFFSFFN